MWRYFARRKALVKTISWRGLSFLVTTLAVWALTERLSLAASVGVAEVVVKSLGYYLHECLWESVDLHRLAPSSLAAWCRARIGRLATETPAIQPEESIL